MPIAKNATNCVAKYYQTHYTHNLHTKKLQKESPCGIIEAQGGDSVVYVWIGALIALIVVEAATVQLVTIWFALGALAALIATLLKASLYVQIGVFIAASIIALIATRPLVKKLTKQKASPTNADRFIGETAIVTEEIDSLQSRGTVKVKGSVWSAKTDDGSNIPAGHQVTVKRIEGVKLVVEKAEATASKS